MQARFYAPMYGRFLSPDPARDQHFEETQSWNIYSYVQNHPTMSIDPNGMAEQPMTQRERAEQARAQGNNLVESARIRTGVFALSHPKYARAIGDVVPGSNNVSTNAVRFSTQIGLSETPNREGSQVNAARHAIWSATMTSWFGSSIATQAGDAHENNPNILGGRDPNGAIFNNSATADSVVDQLNNEIGRSIGSANPGADMNTLTGLVINEFSTNGLWTTSRQKDGTYTVQRTKLDSKQSEAAKKKNQELDSNGRKKKEDAK